MSELESVIEDKLIAQLTIEGSYWTYRPDLKTEDDLWNNIRNKLNAYNTHKLDGHLITDSEMGQIKEFIKTQGESPFKAAMWLAGEHGLAQIPLKREDARLGSISLDAIDNRDIASGHSTYEVINQYVAFKGADNTGRNRRFDVTLLINGFPMIHIELKNQDHSYDEAFHQIHKYIGEGKFFGLFGLVQMFVISNATDTKYIAAATHDKFNKKFLASWVDKDNHRVNDYLSFAKEALNIPRAHELVGKYSVIDATSKSLLLLRPYQIHAIEAVKEACKNPDISKRSGYIWHTTGSGKTITSFNVTRNLLDIPAIDKAIFLIDRKDLDQQTTISFKSYAESTGDSILESENTKALEKNLKSKDRIVIVATRQKLDCLLDKCRDALKAGDESAYYYKLCQTLKKKNVAFVVDECHRAISGAAKDEITRFFDSTAKKSMWFGFTGTPIFDENKKAENGNSARTTEAQYGPCLHKYTIKEALHDKAVLGFQVQNSGFSLQELDNNAKDFDFAKTINIEESNRAEFEKKFLEAYRQATNKDLYDSQEHRRQVIDYICNKSAILLRLEDGPRGEAFSAILTCSSIEQAQKYYKEFKEFISNGGIKESVKRKCSDFPKIAITYSVSENEESSEVNQNEMKAAIEDYNRMFKTKCSLENISGYNTDLNDRLARKKGKYKVREEQLDLVIVVDRLLTGFDAPCISTLFIDRQPMSAQGIIQAFSRTNRIFSEKKGWGQILTFQTPGLFKEAFDNALQLYSNGGGSSVIAPSYEECKERLEKALSRLKSFKAKPEDIDISGVTDISELKQFAKLYQSFDRALAAIKTYEEWENESESVLKKIDMPQKSDEEQLSSREDELCAVISDITGISISKSDIDTYTGKYKNAIAEIHDRACDDSVNTSDIDINYELESVSQTQIDYEYLVALIQKHISSIDESESSQLPEIHDPAVEKYISGVEERNNRLGEVLRAVWNQLKSNPSSFIGKQAIQVINGKISEIIKEKIESFCKEWCVSLTDMNYQSEYYSKRAGLKISNIETFCNYDAYSSNGGGLSRIKYRQAVRKQAENLIVEEILPLRDR